MLRHSLGPFAPVDYDGSDRRLAVERADKERAAERNSRIEAQSSPLLTPQERVQRWEDLHGVRLPTDPNHKLVRVIATQTALAIEQVRDEQTRRRTGTRNVYP